MKLVSFLKDGSFRAGRLEEKDCVTDLGGATVQEIISGKAITHEGEKLKLCELTLGPPINDPRLIVCLGLNYKDHADEVGLKYPEAPLLFSKAPTALCGPYDEVILPGHVGKLDYEVELAIVMGKKCQKVSKEEAHNYVAGYSTFHDVSARCAQFSDKQWFRGKSCDTFAPMGPFLVTPDEIKDPDNLNLWCKVNGEIRQKSNTQKMFFSTSEIISYISYNMTLSAGDIIATGTPAGVGAFMKVPQFLVPGDVVEMEVENLGIIKNRISPANEIR